MRPGPTRTSIGVRTMNSKERDRQTFGTREAAVLSNCYMQGEKEKRRKYQCLTGRSCIEGELSKRSEKEDFVSLATKAVSHQQRIDDEAEELGCVPEGRVFSQELLCWKTDLVDILQSHQVQIPVKRK